MFLIIITLPACAIIEKLETAVSPKMITSTGLNLQGKLIFIDAYVSQIVNATEEAFNEKKWKVLYEGSELPKEDYSLFSNARINTLFFIPVASGHDSRSWNTLLMNDMKPVHFITGKTPTSPLSWGAELFIVIFESSESDLVVAVSVASGQMLEKDKLETYLNEYIELLNKYMD